MLVLNHLLLIPPNSPSDGKRTAKFSASPCAPFIVLAVEFLQDSGVGRGRNNSSSLVLHFSRYSHRSRWARDLLLKESCGQIEWLLSQEEIGGYNGLFTPYEQRKRTLLKQKQTTTKNPSRLRKRYLHLLFSIELSHD